MILVGTEGEGQSTASVILVRNFFQELKERVAR